MFQPFSLRMRNKAVMWKADFLRGTEQLEFSAKDMQQATLCALQQWCDEQGIGQPLLASGGWVFTKACMTALEETLALEKLAPLNVALEEERVKRLQQGANEYKHYGEQPTEFRVLCSFPAHSKRCFPLRVSQSRYHLDVDRRQLELSQCKGLMVIENLDVFYWYGSEKWPAPLALQDYLVVYRGHNHMAASVKALQAMAAEQQLPQVLFADLDCKGVSMAVHEGFSHLLLPSVEQAQAAATHWQAPAEQIPFFAGIEAAVPAAHPLAQYVALLREGKGLLQQGMLNMPLRAEALPR